MAPLGLFRAFRSLSVLLLAASASKSYAWDSDLDLDKSNNLIGWWGSGWFDGTYQVPQICDNPAYSVVILSFLYTNMGFNGWPAMTFNVDNTNASAAQIAAGATGLMWMPKMARQIKECQNRGKKVMLSIGGGAGNVTFTSDEEATAFATQVWQLFGGDTQTLKDLRPYGDVVLDGFDLDNETHDTIGYNTLVFALRKLMNSDSSKAYYISSAPQCPQPKVNPNLPLEAMQAMDFVNVQFYNNGRCNHGKGDFLHSVQQWSKALAGNSSQAKLFIAGIADPREGTGYISPSKMVDEIAQVAALKAEYGLDNIAGYAFWDLAEGMHNGFDTVVKEALVKDMSDSSWGR